MPCNKEASPSWEATWPCRFPGQACQDIWFVSTEQNPQSASIPGDSCLPSLGGNTILGCCFLGLMSVGDCITNRGVSVPSPRALAEPRAPPLPWNGKAISFCHQKTLNETVWSQCKRCFILNSSGLFYFTGSVRVGTLQFLGGLRLEALRTNSYCYHSESSNACACPGPCAAPSVLLAFSTGNSAVLANSATLAPLLQMCKLRLSKTRQGWEGTRLRSSGWQNWAEAHHWSSSPLA